MKREMALVILLVISISINSAIASDEILLKSRRFTPAKGITAAITEKIQAVPGRAHVLLQLVNIPTIKERKELEADGIELLSYVSNRAWFASIPSDKAGKVAGLSKVRAISEILPEDKISPELREAGVNDYSTNEEGEAKLVVLFFDDVSLNDASAVVSSYGGTTIGAAPIINALVIYLPQGLIYELASHDSVHWIDQHYEPAICNDGSRVAIGVNTVQAPPYNLTGTGVIAGEWDGGWVDTSHDDLEGRVTIGDSGSSTQDHPTHVAGTMLGNGSVDWTYRGMAPSAEVISYEWWNDLNELYTEYDSAINTFGIDLSTNSWYFAADHGVYDAQAKAIDDVITGASGKRIPIMWAAGNERNQIPNRCDNGDYDCITIPATAKNIITVGATNSNDDSMTSFSSWGPTDDGRIKPDVVAAGCENDGRDTCEDIYTDPSIGIWSTVPDNLYTDYCPPPDDIDDFQYPYSAMCGTSMSTPAVSGSVALMLEDWRENHSGQPDPLPSTIKAILIQTATDLGNPGPDYSYGYGQINVTDAIDLIREDTSNDVILEDSIIERGDIDIFGVTVPEEQSELKITLVWDDYPGDPARPEALVNDLDLVVRAPDHTRHYPWTLDPAHPGVDAGRGDPDNINNVEQVFVGNPTSGTWRIEISETKLPQPGQLYSLVSNLGFGPAPPYAYDGSVLTETNTDVEILLEGSDDGLPTPPGVLTYIVTSLPSQGTLSDPGAGAISSVPYTLVDNGNQVIYMPNTDYLGPDSFEFKANDGGTAPDGGDSNEATINVYVFGVVNWWKFDETSGTTAHDSGVGHNDGVVHGAAWITGQIDGGLDFDGNNDYVDFDLGALEALKGDSVTISAWIWVEAGDLYCPIVRQYDFEGWDHFGYDLYVGRGGEAYFYLDNTYARCTDDRISSGEWRHLAGTYDGQELRIYLDGALKDSTSYAGTGRNTDAYIGYGIYGENEDDYYFDGIIDDVRVYKGAVDVDEIWDKMYYGTSKFSVVDSSGVRVAWFDDLGNLFLKGTLTRETTPTATANDEFRLQDSEDNDVAIIDATNGNMEIFGLLKLDSDNEWEDPNEEKDEFIIYDDADPLNPVAYIDELGDLYLKGQLYEVEP